MHAQDHTAQHSHVLQHVQALLLPIHKQLPDSGGHCAHAEANGAAVQVDPSGAQFEIATIHSQHVAHAKSGISAQCDVSHEPRGQESLA